MVKETNYIMGLWGIVKQVPCTSCFGTNNSTALYDYGDQTPKKPKQFSHLSQLLLFIDIFLWGSKPTFISRHPSFYPRHGLASTSRAQINLHRFIGIDFQISNHTQNGMDESPKKLLQLIMQPIVLKSNLPSLSWGYAVLRVPSSYD